MNSMPAVSKAPLTSSNVDERLGGTSSTASKRLIVLAVTPAFFANCSVVQRRALLAERIWRPVIIDSQPIGEKRGEVEPEDLSGNLVVQLGVVPRT
jgi:hypothetical protein